MKSKRILALMLALVMTLSLMTVANAFNDDKDIDAKYDEAVTVLSELKVFKGVNDGSNFAPKQTITRAEVAAIIYRIVTGDVADRQDGILDCAYEMLRPGGRMVYSTCTFAPEEDEGSVHRFLERHPHCQIAERIDSEA